MARNYKHIEYFYHYVAYSPIIVATDCHALTFWNTTKAIPADVEHFMSYIAQFNITFVIGLERKFPRQTLCQETSALMT